VGSCSAKLDVGHLEPPALVVHGGAGNYERLRRLGQGAYEMMGKALEASLDAGWVVLGAGGSALLAVVEAVASMEASGMFNAGRGSVPTTAGTVEMDAAVMDGEGCRAGAVCATTWPANPVRAALLVAGPRRAHLDDAPRPAADVEGPLRGGPGLATASSFHPLLLAGPGADELSRAAGLEQISLSAGEGPPALSEEGTVGAVAVGADGHVAAATSTGGRRGQRPGRVGDSPIIGAGTWADDSIAAVSATGTGEAFILAGFAHRVDWVLRQGRGLDEAVVASLEAVAQYGGTGGAIALRASGDFAAAFDTAAMARGWRDRQDLAVRL